MSQVHSVIGLGQLVLAIIVGIVGATTIHVPADQPAIQAGITAASDGDTVLVAPGRYLENINFRGKNVVVASHYFIDADPSHIAETIIDGSSPAENDTASCVLIVSGEDNGAILDGFTLTGGTGTVWTDIHLNADYREGGGILIELSSPVIRNNLIIDNEAVNTSAVTSAGGGGIRCGDADPLIHNNVICYNRGRYGAGIVMNFSTGTIRNNVIAHNTGGQDYGGSGIWTYETGPTTVENNTIVGNISTREGGGILVWSTSVNAQNNILWANTSGTGQHQIGLLGGGSIDITYSAVEGEWEGEGNIDANPLLAGTNVYLTAASPCIDTGNPASNDDPEDPGNPGFAQFPAMGGLRNDMGAYGGTPWALWDPFTAPDMVLEPTEISFDYVQPGACDTAQLLIQNTGCGELSITDIETMENPAYDIAVDPQPPLTVDPYAELSVIVTYAPAENVTLFDSLFIFHNDPGLTNPTLIPMMLRPFIRITDGIMVNDGGDSRSVNWVDFDNDDALDLFVSNGLSGGENNFLYRSNGDGSFTKIMDAPIVNDGRSSDGSSWGDVDNDGDLDAYVVNWYEQDNLFYRNNGDGSFDQVIDGDLVNDAGYSETCSWGDYDTDGYLDLVVANSGMNQAEVNFLYHNNNDGSFSRVLDGVIVTDENFSRCTSWADYDNDGDLDLFVANEADEHNALYENNGDGTFAKVTSGPVVMNSGNSMGGSWGDYDNDSDLDLFVTNSSDQNNFLYRNNGDGSFTRMYNGIQVNDHGWSFGSSWGDYDNDGDLDLFVANGWDTPQTNFLYENNGDGSFSKITDGDIVTDEGWSFGAAWADYDRDGDLDLFVARWYDHTENNALYRNTGCLNHWISISCTGTYSNRCAIGTKIRVLATINGASMWQLREISGQTGYCGQNDLATHFGVGDATTVDSIVVEWPSGIVQVETNVAADQFYEIAEEGILVDDSPLGPSAFILEHMRPNPSRKGSEIHFNLPVAMRIALTIHDMAGRQVISLLARNETPAGAHTVRWNGTDQENRPVGSGVYIVRLSSALQSMERKLVLMR